MSTIVKGSLEAFLQRSEFEFDPQRGYLARYYYDGASQPHMLSLQQLHVKAGIACNLTYERDKATLEVHDSTQQYTIDTWQIVGNDESRDILSHPNLIAITNDAEIAAMRRHLNQDDSPEDAFDDAELVTLSDSPDGALAKRFYSLYQRGTTGYRHSQYVLRHTTNAPASWQRNIADIGVNCIYAPAALLSEAQDSSLWILPLPPRLAYKLNAIPAPAPLSDYFWGWLKSPSTETTSAYNRVEITTEYSLDQWSTDLYDLY